MRFKAKIDVKSNDNKITIKCRNENFCKKVALKNVLINLANHKNDKDIVF